MQQEAEKLSKWIKKLQKKSLNERLSKKSGYFGSHGTDSDLLKVYERKLKTIYERLKCCQSEIVLKQKELPVAFVTFKSRWGAAVAAQTQQAVNPMHWVTEWAPEPRDVSWHNLSIPYARLVFHKIGIATAVLFLTVFFTVPVTAVQGLAQLDKIKEWFPPFKALLLIPGLRSILTGYLPSIILNIFIYIIPFAMLLLADIEGSVSTSSQERKACSMFFYFLIANVFFLSLLSGSLLDQIGESFTHPRNIPNRLASAVSAQADFFMAYILTTGLAGFPLEILQLGLLLWHLFKVHSFGRGQKHEPYIYSVPYYRIIPNVSLFILIRMTYATIAPLQSSISSSVFIYWLFCLSQSGSECL
ncbi:hypothetical protein SUGI_0986360 [Cryptomeria japonica]|nr:hypothetical protein SUGI_0986360 [Cryptomeria japonica]